MGVDYLQCDGCSSGFRDDDDYSVYCDCGSTFCTKNCGKLDNYYTYRDLQKQPDVKEDDPRWEELDNGHNHIDKSKPITCCICRKEKYNHYVLLQALLQHYNLTEADAFEIYKNQKD